MNSNFSTDSPDSNPDSTTPMSQTTVSVPAGGSVMPTTGASSSPSLFSTGTPFRNATLARQPSFDHGGEGRLSSTQVKQRLKTHVLNRRKQSSGSTGSSVGSRHRRSDDRFVLGSHLNTSQGSEPNPASTNYRGGGGGGGFWDSNDSANSFDSDWNEPMTGGKSEHSMYNKSTDSPFVVPLEMMIVLIGKPLIYADKKVEWLTTNQQLCYESVCR
ncbi:unnamed protein product [Echinostoma caproni]|uniref:TORC_M domain-containing protein n=1 Tax=Echinostoma caproni TaxID=27848 RepID=A0A183B0P3_9TREM|nr:unnamed protein product [Echinostoma caproni]